jgi:hypothetical protein
MSSLCLSIREKLDYIVKTLTLDIIYVYAFIISLVALQALDSREPTCIL